MSSARSRCLPQVRRTRGFTLAEGLLVGVVVSMLLLVMVKISSRMFTFIARSQTRQKANMEARRCLETIERMMSNGRASTLMISTPATSPMVPNSRVQFTAMDGSFYTILWSTAPMNTVHIRRTPAGSAATTDTLLATHVNVLVFLADLTDPAIVTVSLQMTVPLDTSNPPKSVYTIPLFNRTLRMISS